MLVTGCVAAPEATNCTGVRAFRLASVTLAELKVPVTLLPLRNVKLSADCSTKGPNGLINKEPATDTVPVADKVS